MEALWDELNERNRKLGEGMELTHCKLLEVQAIVEQNNGKVDAVVTQWKSDMQTVVKALPKKSGAGGGRGKEET